jgi:hypothetical protein
VIAVTAFLECFTSVYVKTMLNNGLWFMGTACMNRFFGMAAGIKTGHVYRK